MNALTFKWAIEKRGLREYDFGVEVSRYKTEWADCSRDILDFTLANPKSKSAWFFLKARALIKQPAQALSTLPSIGKLSPSGFPSLKRLL
jgi:CelD/BcsL family acetyltransferase involved in cellulose biosynthesis